MGLPVPIGLGLALGLPTTRPRACRRGRGRWQPADGLLRAHDHRPAAPESSCWSCSTTASTSATGGQPTAAPTVDFVAAARACGLHAAQADDAAALTAALDRAAHDEGPWLLRVPVGSEVPPTAYFLEDPVVLRADFDRWLASRRAGEV